MDRGVWVKEISLILLREIANIQNLWVRRSHKDEVTGE